MNKTLATLSAVGLVCAIASPLASGAMSPEEARLMFQQFYIKRFPQVPVQDFANGVYSIDPVGRANWEAIEEFPPYEAAIDNGKTIWETPFANGKTYSDCFPSGPALSGKYPYWDKERGMVITLALALNECRTENGEKPYDYLKGPLVELEAYVAFESRGQVIDVKIPEDDPRALEAFNKGKEFYFTRRGQFNFACGNCHMGNAGNSLRTEILSPAFGHTTHWPVYRSKWGEIAPLHRRYGGCMRQVRAAPFEPQSEELRNLEYYMTYMDSGLERNGPGSRK